MQAVYQSALTLHVVALVVCVALGLMFIVTIMNPSVKRTMQESRRVAELLTCLPSDMNVEVYVNQALGIADAIAPNADTTAGRKGKSFRKSALGEDSDDDAAFVPVATAGRSSMDRGLKLM
jgi:hypothetical protein